MQFLLKPRINSSLPVHRVLLWPTFLWRLSHQITSSPAIASLRGTPLFLNLSHRTHIIHSAGRMDSSTGPLSIRSVSSVILDMGAPPVLPTLNPTISSSLTSTVGINYRLASVPVGQALRGKNVIANYYECVGIRHHSTALEPRSRSTFLKLITRSRYKAN